MISKINYKKRNITKVLNYFKKDSSLLIDSKLIEEHLYCLGLLESFSKIGMNFVLIGNMATYLMCDNNMYLPNSLEIMVNKQDFLNDYLIEVNSIFKAIDYQIITQNSDYVLYQYTFKSVIQKEVKIYLNVRLENHIINEVASIPIDKPYIINEDRIYRLKTPYYERLFAEAMYNFAPNLISLKNYSNDSFPLFIIKQLVDLTQLYVYIERFDIVINSFHVIIDNNKANFLHHIYDTYNSLVNIYCQGKYRKELYGLLKEGIKEIQRFRVNELITMDNIFQIAAYPLLACSCIYRKCNCLDVEINMRNKMDFYTYSKINDVRKLNVKTFNVVYRAIEIFDNLEVVEAINRQ